MLVNVPNVDRNAVAENAGIARAVAQAEAEMGDSGRVLLRPSGTEPVVRVMVEATDQNTAREIAQRLVDVVRSEISIA